MKFIVPGKKKKKTTKFNEEEGAFKLIGMWVLVGELETKAIEAQLPQSQLGLISKSTKSQNNKY